MLFIYYYLLDFRYNQLEQIPQTLNECILLKELNVESNLIEELPVSLKCSAFD